MSAMPIAPGLTAVDSQLQVVFRRQLSWFAWLRLIVLTTALVTTLVLHLVIQPVQMEGINLLPLWGVFGLGFVLSTITLLALASVQRVSVLAALSFGGDVLLETALLLVLGTEDALAFVVALFFLSTLLACSYLDRTQGTAFATVAFLLQALVELSTQYRWLPDMLSISGVQAPPDPNLPSVILRLFIFMLTFSITAWVAGRRQESLAQVGASLSRVSDDFHELQAFNEHVIRSMTTGLVTTDPQGVITHANAVAEELLCLERGAARGQRLFALLGWDDLDEDEVFSSAPRSADRGREAVLGGRRVVIAWSASRIEDRKNRELGLLLLLDDVTEVRALETEVRRTGEMAAIGEMAAGIAHEIRNPLASLSGSVQMLQKRLEPKGDSGRLMNIVLKESRRLDATITEFLHFARPRAVRPRTIDLGELARETLTLMRNSEELREDHILLEPTTQGVFAEADADQLKQVTWNLFGNAIKAMPDGGTLTVSVEHVGDEAVLTVEDTGVGMTPEMKERAFQPLVGSFGRGMGLGLAIVYRIVKDHGGRVLIDSETGRGTKIAVHLPRAHARERQAEAGERPSS